MSDLAHGRIFEKTGIFSENEDLPTRGMALAHRQVARDEQVCECLRGLHLGKKSEHQLPPWRA